MNVEDQNVMALVAVPDGDASAAKKPLGYWARTGQKYRVASMALCLVLAVFLIVFTAFC